MAQRGPYLTLPTEVYATLRAGFVAYEASTLIGGILRDRPSQANRIQNLGDPFGKVFAWVWETDQDQAMMLLDEYLSYLRKWDPQAKLIQPRIERDEVLAGLRMALPNDFQAYQAVVNKAKRDVR